MKRTVLSEGVSLSCLCATISQPQFFGCSASAAASTVKRGKSGSTRGDIDKAIPEVDQNDEHASRSQLNSMAP